MEKLILTAETILPISSKPITKGAVYIADGKIKEVGKATSIRYKYADARILELGDGILLPGFINAHTHLELGWISKKIGKFNGFIEWLQQIIVAKTEGVTTEEMEAAVEEGIKTLIESGVTTVAEISSYGGLDKPILKNSGLRTILYREIFDRHGDSWNSFEFENNETYEERPFPHAPYSCSPDFIEKALSFSRQNEIPIGVHLAESPDEVRFLKGESNGFDQKIFPLIGRKSFPIQSAPTPFKHLKQMGLSKREKVTAIHMVQVQREEVEEIKHLGLGIVLCPRSNLFLRVGAPPVKHYAKLSRIGIGTDGLSSNLNLNFLEELRFFYITFADEIENDAAFFTIYLATLGGAKALFLEDKVGSIEVDKDADLIFLSPGNMSIDPYLSVISSNKEDLKLVMVKGKTIYSKTNSSNNN